MWNNRQIGELLQSESVGTFYTPIATVIYQTALSKSNIPHAEIVTYTGQDKDNEQFDYFDLRKLKGALGSGAGTPTPVIDNLDSTSSSNSDTPSQPIKALDVRLLSYCAGKL